MKKISYGLFRFLKFFVRLFYPKTEVIGAENLPEEPCIVAANHAQMNGPIVSELYFPGEKNYTWCAGEMMKLKEVPEYAYHDFWPHKPKRVQWFYKGLSYVIAPLAVLVFKNARTISVYHDKRVIFAFRETVEKLRNGSSVVIFPERAEQNNNILCKFQEGFVDAAKMYYKQTGKTVSFVPMYVAPALRKMYIGKPIAFDHENDIKDERKRICDYITEQITEIAVSLPRHKVVPYNNVSKKEYAYNK